MPRDAVSRTANVERTGRHKWVKAVNTNAMDLHMSARSASAIIIIPLNVTVDKMNIRNLFYMILYYNISKILLNGSHMISENGKYCSM